MIARFLLLFILLSLTTSCSKIKNFVSELTAGQVIEKSALLSQAPKTVNIEKNESKELDISSVFTFESGDRYEVQSLGQTINGEIISLDQSFKVLYRPFYNFVGSDNWSFILLDRKTGKEVHLKIPFEVTGGPSGPVGVDDRYSTSSTVSMDVLENDFGGVGKLNVSSTLRSPNHGTLSLDDNTFTYKTNGDFQGIDSFRYQLRDSEGVTSEATVRIIVSPGGKAYPLIDSNIKALPLRVIFIRNSEQLLSEAPEADGQKVVEILNAAMMYDDKSYNEFKLIQVEQVQDDQLSSMSIDDYATLTQRYGVNDALTVAFVDNIADSILGLSYVGCLVTGCPYSSPAGGQARAVIVTEYSRLKKSNGNYIDNELGSTFVHEFGHSMGLEHVMDTKGYSTGDSIGGLITFRECDLDTSYYQHRKSLGGSGYHEDPITGKWRYRFHVMYPYSSSARKDGFFKDAYGPALSRIMKCYNQRSANGLGL
jgi:hypothetical protein